MFLRSRAYVVYPVIRMGYKLTIEVSEVFSVMSRSSSCDV